MSGKRLNFAAAAVRALHEKEQKPSSEHVRQEVPMDISVPTVTIMDATPSIQPFLKGCVLCLMVVIIVLVFFSFAILVSSRHREHRVPAGHLATQPNMLAQVKNIAYEEGELIELPTVSLIYRMRLPSEAQQWMTLENSIDITAYKPLSLSAVCYHESEARHVLPGTATFELAMTSAETNKLRIEARVEAVALVSSSCTLQIGLQPIA